MDYLYQRNRWVARELGPEPTVAAAAGREREITAAGKDVVVIGGGDTGADCVGNALREGARSIVQLELLPEPPPQPARRPHAVAGVAAEVPAQLRDGGGHASCGVGEQDYSVATTALRRRRRRRASRRCTSPRPSRAPPFAPVPGTERELPAQLVLLAMGFLHPEQGLLDQLGVERTRAATSRPSSPYTTSVEGVFAAGDARRGQSLIVWAINEGRQCARMVDRYLAGGATARGAAQPRTTRASPATPTPTRAPRARRSTSARAFPPGS